MDTTINKRTLKFILGVFIIKPFICDSDKTDFFFPYTIRIENKKALLSKSIKLDLM